MTRICQTHRGQEKGSWCSAVQCQGAAKDVPKPTAPTLPYRALLA